MVSGEQAIVNQLCKLNDEITALRRLSEKKDDRDVDIFFMNIPEDGGTRTFESGITKIDFKTGIIVNPDGTLETLEINMGIRDFMHSLNVMTDKDVKIRLDASKQHTISANNQETIPYITYTSIGIECTESTEITLFACTNPSTVLGSFMTVLKGQNGVVAQESTGELITVIKGDQGVVAQDANNKMISIMQGAEGIDVAQDTSGAFETLMKGIDSDGSLQTAALNANGKFEMYIYDQTDPLGITNTIGLSELAQRIGTPILYDRRGQVVWYDNFEAPVLKWQQSTFGADSSISLDTDYVHEGMMAVRLIAGADAARYALITRYEMFLNTTNSGMALSFSIGDKPVILEFNAGVFNGTSHKFAGIKFDQNTDSLYYLNSSNVWTIFANGTQKVYTGNHVWGNFKLVVDWTTNKYIRCIFQNTTFDLSAYDIYTTAVADVGDTSYVQIKLNGDNVSDRVTHIDKVVITTNEPEN